MKGRKVIFGIFCFLWFAATGIIAATWLHLAGHISVNPIRTGLLFWATLYLSGLIAVWLVADSRG